MSKKTIFKIAVSLMMVLPFAASASDFDGSKPLICASIYSAKCHAGDQECVTGAPWMINFPVFMEVDFKAKTLSTTKEHENQRSSNINHVSKINEGHTAIQGTDNEYVWSMLISEDTGSMTLTISGEATGFIVFGACHVK